MKELLHLYPHCYLVAQSYGGVAMPLFVWSHLCLALFVIATVIHFRPKLQLSARLTTRVVRYIVLLVSFLIHVSVILLAWCSVHGILHFSTLDIEVAKRPSVEYETWLGILIMVLASSALLVVSMILWQRQTNPKGEANN